VTQVFEGTLRRLVEYSWPGNVRELQNVIERGVILSPSNLLVLDREFSHEARAATVAESLESIISGASSLPGTSLREAERRHIESALAATNWVIEGERRREDFGRSSEYVTQPHEKTKHPAAGRSAYERGRLNHDISWLRT
jgi:transcriptional regulator with GAF, ATPase, and Fis domain